MPWSLIIRGVALLAIVAAIAAGGWEAASNKYHAKLARYELLYKQAIIDSATQAQAAQAAICEKNRKITEDTDNAAQARIKSLTAKYNAATDELRRKAESGLSTCSRVSAARPPGDNQTTTNAGTSEEGYVSGWDIVTLGRDGEENGEIAASCSDFLDKLYATYPTQQ